MADGFCYPSVNFEGYRVTVLDELGAPDPGDGNLYVAHDGIDADVKWTTKDGTQYTQQLGNGSFCVDEKGPSVITGATVTVQVCPWEYVLIGLLTGWPVAYDGDGKAIGVSMLSPAVVASRRICLELYALAGSPEDRGSYGGLGAYHHHGFPMASCVLGDFKLDNAVDPLPLVFTCNPNDSIGQGPFGDWPLFDNDGDADFSGDPEGAWFSYLDTDFPDALCETQVLPPVGS